MYILLWGEAHHTRSITTYMVLASYNTATYTLFLGTYGGQDRALLLVFSRIDQIDHDIDNLDPNLPLL